MKKLLALFAIALVLPLSVLAEELNETIDEDELAEEAGMLPDNPFYFLKKWGEGLQRFLTFDEEKLAELESVFAERRLAEMISAQKQGKNSLIEKLSRDYEKSMNRVETALKNHGESTLNKIKTTLKNGFTKFNESVENGEFPETIEITNNVTLELLNDYTEQTNFTPEELRDLVFELLTQVEESEDWTVQKELTSLAGRLVWEARKTIEPETELEIENDEVKIKELALKVGSSTAKHLAVLDRVLEKAPESAKQGLMNAINSSQNGYARAIIAINNRARIELNNSGIEDMIRIRNEFKEQIKNKIIERIPQLKKQIQTVNAE
ncbi:MAG: hypothetical protein GON13_03105 [Nanoarchaeota archaeon]|nr:hypothetical protein [Nanoarchaeota archaeon]